MKHYFTLNYASNLHADRNLLYDDQPYSVHLTAVYTVLEPFFGDNDVVMQAALCHDLLEDTGITYNDLRSQVGAEVADVVYDVTNELGKNRQERAERTYPKIAANPLAVIVKVADRIANMNHSRAKGSSMFRKYCAEYPKFRNALYNANHVNQYPNLANLWYNLDCFSSPSA
jgi:guanosine-3',5'-bis(diphosphate) 3'-pyrophosphohydrolase